MLVKPTIIQSQQRKSVNHEFTHFIVELLSDQTQRDVQIFLHHDKQGVVNLLVQQAVHDAKEAQGMCVLVQELLQHENEDEY